MCAKQISATPLPPNQALAAPGKWPVVGENAPADSAEPWSLTIGGLVGQTMRWSLDEVQALPQQELLTDIHCVTRWSRLGVRFTGVRLADLLALAGGATPEARFITFIARSSRAHSTSLPLTTALDLGTLIAFTHQGQPLETIHGGPVRTIVPGRYFYKSLKWLTHIALLAEDRLGYWEGAAGYHNNADPWAEERYIVRGIDRVALGRMLQARDIAGRDLLGLTARLMSLPGLNARGALLRNADFTQAELDGADFQGANLSNAHFAGARLNGANFTGADLEGADFRGADLRGANLTGASLFGATFTTEPTDPQPQASANIDTTTTLALADLDRLSPAQRAFIRSNNP